MTVVLLLRDVRHAMVERLSRVFWQSDKTSNLWGTVSHDYMRAKRGDITKTAPYEQYGCKYNATINDFKRGGEVVSRKSMPMPNINTGLSVGNRFWDKRLGLIVAANLKNNYRGTERDLNKEVMGNGESTGYITSLKKHLYAIHDLNLGLHAKVDLSLGNHKISTGTTCPLRHCDGL